MKLLTVREMRAVERAANAAGHPYADMLAHAGRSLAQIIAENYGWYADKILALAGKGNNGGDALIALTHLKKRGWECTALLVDRPPQDDLAGRAGAAGVGLISWGDAIPGGLARLIEGHPLLLDGLLGTGIRLPLRGLAQAALAEIAGILAASESPPLIIAVDIPSGVDADTGTAAPETLPADLTVAMAAAKPGHYAFPAARLSGRIEAADIGLPAGLPEWAAIRRFVVDAGWVKRHLPPRPADAHKGAFGTAMIVAGSRRHAGAALLAGRAAFRVGAGLLVTACPEGVYRLIAGHFPESSWLPLPEEEGAIAASAAAELAANLGRATAMLIGPGLGLAEGTRWFLQRFLQTAPPPLVVDADGLRLLTQIPEWHTRLPPDGVLTPHPGEMSALAGLAVEEVQRARLAAAEEHARRWGQVVVLKGAFTVVAAPDGRTALIPFAVPALARGGTGDVLAGMITGLRAQGMAAFEAAVCGAWLHAQAGRRAAEAVGSAAVLAGDVAAEIGAARRELEGDDQPRVRPILF
jgi:NAD(P)H-hydrate epimerase